MKREAHENVNGKRSVNQLVTALLILYITPTPSDTT